MKWDIRECRETNLDSLVDSNKVGDLHHVLLAGLRLHAIMLTRHPTCWVCACVPAVMLTVCPVAFAS
jgi:hypothetical protein